MQRDGRGVDCRDFIADSELKSMMYYSYIYTILLPDNHLNMCYSSCSDAVNLMRSQTQTNVGTMLLTARGVKMSSSQFDHFNYQVLSLT